MATTSSSPTLVDIRKLHRHQLLPIRQSSAITPRSLALQAKTEFLSNTRQSPPSNIQAPSRHVFVDDTLPHSNYVTSKVIEGSRSSFNREKHSSSRIELSPKGVSRQQHRSSRHGNHPSEMTTMAPNDTGPGPIVSNHESRHGTRSERSRTTVPAPSGNWVLGKTIGAGSMGKVKLARKLETGEEVIYCSIISLKLII